MLEIRNEIVGQDDPDPDGVLSATTAAIARGTPDALLPQVNDVKKRMRQLTDNHDDPGVKLAAHQAEIVLGAVQLHLEGDLSAKSLAPSAISLAVLTSELLELGIVLLMPQA